MGNAAAFLCSDLAAGITGAGAFVLAAVGVQSQPRISGAALEVLAIIAAVVGLLFALRSRTRFSLRPRRVAARATGDTKELDGIGD